VLIPVLMIVAPTVLVLMQPNLGTSLMLMLAGPTVMFAAGVSLWYFAVVAAWGWRRLSGSSPCAARLAVPARLPVSPDRHFP
jgi:rod shape determining protein RodA